MRHARRFLTNLVLAPVVLVTGVALLSWPFATGSAGFGEVLHETALAAVRGDGGTGGLVLVLLLAASATGLSAWRDRRAR